MEWSAFPTPCKTKKSNSVKAIPGTVEFVRSVAAAGFKLAIGSGATKRDLDLMLTALGLRDLFSLIVSADDVSKSKPDPETYDKAFALLAQKVALKHNGDNIHFQQHRCFCTVCTISP